MPNWVSNSIEVEGKLEHRQEFVEKNKGFHFHDTMKDGEYKELSFHASVPVPKKHINSKKGDGWYHWCINKWGTKWDASEPCVDHSKHSTSYGFETAWSPPTDWIEAVSKKFPHLMFKVTWVEEQLFGARFDIQGGDYFWQQDMTEEQCKEYMGIEDDEEE